MQKVGAAYATYSDNDVIYTRNYPSHKLFIVHVSNMYFLFIIFLITLDLSLTDKQVKNRNRDRGIIRTITTSINYKGCKGEERKYLEKELDNLVQFNTSQS